jgi:hypothetical protein
MVNRPGFEQTSRSWTNFKGFSSAAHAGLPQRTSELDQHRFITITAAPHLNQLPFVKDDQPIKESVDGYWRTNNRVLQPTWCCKAWASVC